MFLFTLLSTIVLAAAPLDRFTTEAGKPLDPAFVSAVVQPLAQSHLEPLARKCFKYPATDVYFRVEVRLNWSDPLAVDVQSVEIYRGRRFVRWDRAALDCLNKGLAEIVVLPELSAVAKKRAAVVNDQLLVIYNYYPSEPSP